MIVILGLPHQRSLPKDTEFLRTIDNVLESQSFDLCGPQGLLIAGEVIHKGGDIGGF